MLARLKSVIIFRIIGPGSLETETNPWDIMQLIISVVKFDLLPFVQDQSYWMWLDLCFWHKCIIGCTGIYLMCIEPIMF